MNILSSIYNLIRPICPLCGGTGGAISGYYEPEWSECRLCNPDDEREEKIIRIWFWDIWRHNQEMRELDKWCEEASQRMLQEDEATTAAKGKL